MDLALYFLYFGHLRTESSPGSCPLFPSCLPLPSWFDNKKELSVRAVQGWMGRASCSASGIVWGGIQAANPSSKFYWLRYSFSYVSPSIIAKVCTQPLISHSLSLFLRQSLSMLLYFSLSVSLYLSMCIFTSFYFSPPLCSFPDFLLLSSFSWSNQSVTLSLCVCVCVFLIFPIFLCFSLCLPCPSPSLQNFPWLRTCCTWHSLPSSVLCKVTTYFLFLNKKFKTTYFLLLFLITTYLQSNYLFHLYFSSFSSLQLWS